MKVFGVYLGFLILIGLAPEVSAETTMPILEVDSSQYTFANFDLTDPDDELKIDYFVENASTFTDPGNAFKNIEINAGINQGVFEALVPEGWEAIFYDDKTRFHTADQLYYIYPDDTEPILFSLLYENTQIIIGYSEAMTPLGIWTDPIPVNIVVPEPSTIMLLSTGILLFRKKKF